MKAAMGWAGMVLAWAVLAMASPTWADFQAGVAAYEKGDYVTALQEWRPLAEEGNADAQFYVGALYYHGEGVPQSTTEAARWYRRAADRGHAAAQNEGNAQQARDFVAGRLTAPELAEARRLVQEWKPKP